MKLHSLSVLFAAIVSVESGGNIRAIGDNGKAVGPAQIWEVVVQDVNRIAGTRFTSKDRYSLTHSQEIFRIYTDHYGKKYGWPVSDEVRAKIWNGGPNGPQKRATEKYWRKVQSKM